MNSKPTIIITIEGAQGSGKSEIALAVMDTIRDILKYATVRLEDGEENTITRKPRDRYSIDKVKTPMILIKTKQT